MAVYAWGRASNGQLGIGGIERECVSTPILVDIFSGQLKEIVCGCGHTGFLTVDGTVYTCGNNDNGQLGHDKGQTRPERVDSLELHVVKQIALGGDHTLALTDTGVVFAWGSNNKGQLGVNNGNESLPRPRMIKQFSSVNVVQIACGVGHSLAMTSGGYLFSWGDNSHGQLGIGKLDRDHPLPQFISSLSGIPFGHICAGGFHSFALSLSGTLFGWGKNNFGQLGVADTTDRCMPTLVKSLRSQNVRHVVCGESHTVTLTEEGGVFTFGGGTYGQLGHNSFNHEYNPRKVVDLMGSTVTQITCGRFHTFAYVPSSGKLYSFGLGASGQLGVGQTNNFNSPTRVKHSWCTEEPRSTEHGAPHPTLRQAVAGGDHCFALLSRLEENEEPVDMRIPDRSESLLTLVESEVREMARLASITSSFTEVSRNLEMVFTSQACLNGSFLDKKTHEKTNSRTHGIELSAVRRSFCMLGCIPRESIMRTVCTSVKDNLIPSLRDRPPDIEALRLYIMLPECEVLHKPNYRQSIDVPFGEAILRLSPEAQKVLRRWWATLPSTYFSQVMKVFQDCVTQLLKLPIPTAQEDVISSRQSALSTCLLVLQQLHTVNTESGDIVPFQKFYIPEIQEIVDIRADLYHWLQEETVATLREFRTRRFFNVSTFSFCRFPFVFDARAKTQLLQTDAIMQMQSAVEEVNRRNLSSMYQGMFDPVNPLLVIMVRRDNIVQDTLTQIMKQGPCNLKKPLKVVFAGEEGIDAGGVAKEFFLLLLTEILDPKYGMFKYIEESQTIWFNDKTFEDNPMFLLIGVICGLAIYNSTIIDLRFPPLLYKKLLDRKPNLDDYRGFQPSVARNLQYLLDYLDDDLDSVFGLNFQIVRENYGSLEYIDLIPGGGEKTVTVENRQQYVDLYMDYYLNKAVSKQFDAFSSGFHRVCGGRVLKFFHPEELMQMVVGCQDYDFRDLESVAEYKGDFFRTHHVIKNFWEVFHEFPQNLKKKFLAFLTGSDRVPILGMRSMKIIIQPVAGGESGDHLPVAHTCFNLLDLPRYPTKEMMKNKLRQAVQYSTGFGLA